MPAQDVSAITQQWHAALCRKSARARGLALVWSALVSERGVLQTACSLDGVAERLLYVAGPVITGVITVAVTPAAGLLVTTGLMTAGTGLFLRSPALSSWPAPVAKEASGTPATAPGKADAGREILAPAFATGAIGLCLGGLGLVIVAFTQARHDPAAVARIEAALSAGNALGGLGYGAVSWRIPAQRRLAGGTSHGCHREPRRRSHPGSALPRWPGDPEDFRCRDAPGTADDSARWAPPEPSSPFSRPDRPADVGRSARQLRRSPVTDRLRTGKSRREACCGAKREMLH